MNNNQKQQIKISSFLVLCVCFSALLVFLSERHEGQKGETLSNKALKRVDIYAQRLIEKKFIEDINYGVDQKARGLASAGYKTERLDGLVGLDPWGHPFQYFVKKADSNSKDGVLIIWSKGPDNKLNTTNDQIAENHDSFNGDDFGKAIKFSL